MRINLQVTNQNVWNMSLFEHFFKVLSLYFEVKIRIRIKVMRIRNTALGQILIWPVGTFK
jgi:hypothetical protein